MTNNKANKDAVRTLLFVGVLIGVRVTATGPQTRGNASREHLLTLTASARPQDADPAFDCGWRKLAMEHALALQPGMSVSRHRALFDALQLHTLCNESSYAASGYPAAVRSQPPARSARSVPPKHSSCQFFVDAKDGSDAGNDGSVGKPFATLPHAVSAAREAETGSPCSIELRAGTHRLGETLMLDERDSGLTIEGYDGEEVVLSGARLLDNVAWKPYKAIENAFVADLSRFGLNAMPALRVGEKRATLARYPNADAELDLFPVGYITASDPGDGSEWRAPTYPPYNAKHSQVCDEHMQCGQSKNITVPVSEKQWHGMYQNYTVGVGGACDVYEDKKSPWCSGDFYLQRQFPEMHTRHPSGLNMTIQSWFPGLVNTPYKNSTGAIVHAWRTGHWYTWMFEVGAELHTKAGSWFLFTAGGNQGGEGCNRAGEWFIENVFEELDAPNEYYFDSVAQKLYLVHNDTGAPSSKQPLEAPTLATLVHMEGSSPEKPLVGVTIRGITVTANRPTFMDPRGNPSGGDWALERTGAITMENTENVTIADSLFTRLDSNCISINGYNRHALIANNEAAWLGQNFIAAWGRPDGNDGTGGTFPRYTRVTGNFVHEVGHIQKQSSFFFQAETAQTYIADNIVFNIARAAINFNDGFGGGNEIVHNLLFNTCRESSDHGAFNSWDRLPYLTDIREPGKASTIPAVNNVHRNFIVANYAADGGCLDNDDGSSYYDIHHNFCVYGGHKSDFDGNSKRSFNNIYAYPSVYGTTCLNIGAQELPPKGYAESFFNNTCALPKAGSTYLQMPGNPKKDTQAFMDGLELGGNTIYVPGAAPHIVLADTGQKMSFSAFEALGVDPATIVKDEATAADILAWGKSVLQASK